jgi:hypothetical protein
VPIVFLNPWAGLLVLLLAIPLVAFSRLRERDAAVRATLRLPPASSRALVAPVAAALIAGALLALAATQPALVRSSTHAQRTDAEALFVLDISRSMLASVAPGTPTRLERAKRVAVSVRAGLPGVPAGVASLTDRVLPYVMPTSDERVFRSTLKSAVAAEEPPPTNIYYDRATDLGALADIPPRRFFSPTAKKKLLVVLTDGESRAVASRKVQELRARGLRTVFVHIWGPDDRVFATGRPEKTYHADPESSATLANLAQEANGRAIEETNVGEAVAAARAAIGSGPVEPIADHSYFGLMRPIAAAALIPLLFVLWRRNGWVLASARRWAIERRKRWLDSQESQRLPAPSLQPRLRHSTSRPVS